jgi:hypothetical protein
MTHIRVALLATAAIGLMALATPASAQVVSTADGHYYKLVPLKGPLPGETPRTVMLMPEGAAASAAQIPASNCRLTNFENGEYQPQYVTVCGP